MHNLEVLKDSITESQATELIFDGCRANEAREPKKVGNGCEVTFTSLANGLHQAVLRDASWTPVAMATVDQYDC